ncbi:MAG: flagellar hook-associated protein FlgK, partial [Rhodanobacter sp.]
LDASISDIGTLTGKDYILSYNSGAWSMRDTSGANVAMSGTGTAADPFKAAGLSLVVGAGANAGDSFRIQPSRNAADSIEVAVTNPDKVAAAAPFVVKAGSGNTGNAAVNTRIGDAGNANLMNP